MVSTKLNIGKIPISKGEYQEGIAYQRLNQVTMLGSTYQSKIDDNTSAPAQMGADGAVENINTDKWLCIAVGNISSAKKVVYNNETSGLESGNVQEAIDEVVSKVSDLDTEYRLKIEGNISFPFNVVANTAISEENSKVSIKISANTGFYVTIVDNNDLMVNSNDGYLFAVKADGSSTVIKSNINKNTKYSFKLNYTIIAIYLYRNNTKISGTGSVHYLIGATSSLSNIEEDIQNIKDFDKKEVKPIIELFTTAVDGGNLFNKNAKGIKNGYYLDPDNGNEISNTEMSISDYIPVEKGQTYTFFVPANFFGQTNSRVVHYYIGEQKNHIRTAGIFNASNSSVTFTSEYDGWIKISYYTNTKSTIMCVKSDTYPNKYVKYADYIASESLIIPKCENLDTRVTELENADTGRHYEVNPLYKKKFVMFGDSIGQAGNSLIPWIDIIGKKNEMIYLNKCIAGNGLRVTSSGETYRSSIYNQLISFASIQDYDYIIIQGGVNDGDTNLGTWVKPTDKMDEDYPSMSNLDIHTTYGCMEALCKWCMINLKDKKFGFLITYRSCGPSWNEVSDNLAGICEKYGMPYFDLRKNAGFNLFDRELREIYGKGSTAQHYDETKGYKQDEQVIYLDGYYKLFKAINAIPAPAGAFDKSKWQLMGSDTTDRWHCGQKGYDISAPKIEAWMKTL